MDVLRTPESRFTNLPGYPFAPHYVGVAAGDTDTLRMHYVDEGPPAGPPIVLMHGNPAWSYLYRKMIPPLTDGGHRVLAPDLIGCGRSDKPTRRQDYTYLRHVEWVTSWFDALDLTDVTLVVQDWGSLIGLRVAAEQSARIARVVVANGFLLAGQLPIPFAFRCWRALARFVPGLSASFFIKHGTRTKVPTAELAGYDAPFPDRRFQAGARAFIGLVPTTANDPAGDANRAAWEALGHWHKPFLCVFGSGDPVFGNADQPLIAHVPGAVGQPHRRVDGGHFVQEDFGPELAALILAWQQA